MRVEGSNRRSPTAPRGFASLGALFLAVVSLAALGCSSEPEPQAAAEGADGAWRRVEGEVARVTIPGDLTEMEMGHWDIAYRGPLGERVLVNRVDRPGTLEARVDSAVAVLRETGAFAMERDRLRAAGTDAVRVRVMRDGVPEWHWFFQGDGVFWGLMCRGPDDSAAYCDRVVDGLELIGPGAP